VVAVLFSLILSAAVYIYLERQAIVKPEEDKTVTIYVAAIDIEDKMQITSEMLVKTTVEDSRLYEGVLKDEKEIVGKYTNYPIFKGEPFRSERLIGEIKNELSLNLAETFRAMSLSVTQASGVSDLIKVGDWIDLVVWLPEIKESNRVVRPNISKMILQKIEVLAVNRERDRKDQYTEEIVPTYTLTLSIPVYDLEDFVLAQSVGSIYVALRPYDSMVIFKTPGEIWEDLAVDDFGRMKDLFPQYEIEGKIEMDTKPIEVERYQYYTVLYGDTLRGIAKKFYGDETRFVLIKDVNQIEDVNIIFPGMALKLPILEKED